MTSSTSQVVTLVGVGETKASLKLPSGRLTLGRNVKDLNCTDKKVSREHAFIEVDGDGKVWLTATHVNPCFIHEDAEPKPLKKGERICLEDGGKFSLLPSQFIYKVVIKGGRDVAKKDEDEEEQDNEHEPESEEVSEESEAELSGESESEEESDSVEESESAEESDYVDSPKKKRVNGGSTKKTERGRPARKAVKQPVKVDFINDDPEDDEDYQEDDEDSEDGNFEPSSGSDWEEEKKSKKTSKKKRKVSSDDDSDEDWGSSRKKKRNSASKRPRPSSARRQPTRGSTSRSKYQESDDDDDDE